MVRGIKIQMFGLCLLRTSGISLDHTVNDNKYNENRLF